MFFDVWRTLIGLIAEKCLFCLCQSFFFVTQIRRQTRWEYTTKFVACIWCRVGWCWSLISIPHCFGFEMVWSLRAERTLNSHLPFLVPSVDLETKLELKFCRKFWIELGNSQSYELKYATNIVFAFLINSVDH